MVENLYTYNYCEYELIGKTILVKIHYDVNNWRYPYIIEFQHELDAKLHYDSLVRAREEQVKLFAENMYMKGYRDGRAKRKISDWFPIRLTFRFTNIKY